MTLTEDALAYAKANQKKLIAQVCNLDKYKASKKPFTLFMAGSPGAGKTEYSQNLLKKLELKSSVQKIVRLDTDELRDLLPQYTGKNSDVVQKAATLLFDKAFDLIQKKNLNAIIDTTFSSPRSIQNVKRAIDRKRKVGILYLYQDPIIAWDYTKKREKLEGRTVPKDVFIKAYFLAKENVNQVKTQFGKKIELHLFEKDQKNDFIKKARFNIHTLNSYLKEEYTPQTLEKFLSDRV